VGTAIYLEEFSRRSRLTSFIKLNIACQRADAGAVKNLVGSHLPIR